jgi:dTDP-4-dehydrorhamnose 3,5-epimerase-like enzyme
MEDNFIIRVDTHSYKHLGSLSFFESNKDIPFEFKRVYYIYDVPENSKRGFHAHKKLKQLLWSPYGSIEILLDDGKEKKIFILDNPKKALIIKEGYWREMTWQKKDSVLCVVASDYYDETDYIRDYDEFIRLVKRGYWNNENKF